MSKIFIWIIKFYRKNVSAATSPHCRYSPTCSAYALEAFQKYGFFKGFALSFWRLLRCNPFSKGGYDPVP